LAGFSDGDSRIVQVAGQSQRLRPGGPNCGARDIFHLIVDIAEEHLLLKERSRLRNDCL
jgi:hypothetical protein